MVISYILNVNVSAGFEETGAEDAGWEDGSEETGGVCEETGVEDGSEESGETKSGRSELLSEDTSEVVVPEEISDVSGADRLPDTGTDGKRQLLSITDAPSMMHSKAAVDAKRDFFILMAHPFGRILPLYKTTRLLSMKIEKIKRPEENPVFLSYLL
jgi:hypothetical protein